METVKIPSAGNASEVERGASGSEGETHGARGGEGASAGSDSQHTRNPQSGKRGRGRPRKEKSVTENLEWLAESPQEVEITVEGEEVPKPRKKRQSTKKMLDTKENIFQIFGVVSLFAGDVWRLEQSEAELIAKPLDSILSRYNLLDRAEKYGDTMALTIAIVAVFAPRVLYTINQQREKRREKIEQERAISESTRPSASASSPAPTASTTDILKGLLG